MIEDLNKDLIFCLHDILRDSYHAITASSKQESAAVLENQTVVLSLSRQIGCKDQEFWFSFKP